MVVSQEEKDAIIQYVNKEPRTIQDIAKLIGRSWLTAQGYVDLIAKETGLVQMKVFRPHTRGAVKIVYAPTHEVSSGALQKSLMHQILSGRMKKDLDCMDVYQAVKKEKRAVVNKDPKAFEKYFVEYAAQAQDVLLCFSGNLSFLSEKVIAAMEEALKRKVVVKILCRITIPSLNTISQLNSLQQRYGSLLEVRHRFQPLRGIVTDSRALLREEEKKSEYRQGELSEDIQVFYEIFDGEWLAWLKSVFWQLHRVSLPSQERLAEYKLL